MDAPRSAASPVPDASGAELPGRPAGLPADEEVLGRMAGENFPVALRLLPARTRENLVAIYGFARLTDEIGDRLQPSPAGSGGHQPSPAGSGGHQPSLAARLAALDWLEGELDRALWDPDRTDLHRLVTAAAVMVRRLGIDPQPLRDLIEANRVDQRKLRYETFDELLAYCRLSANPVGRLVLAAFDASTPRREAWSDGICSGLQLVEHWQDVAEDAAAGRIYLPGEDLERFGVEEGDLVAKRATPELRALLVFEAARARRLLDAGAPLVGDLHGRARLAVAGFAAGGYAALDAIADAGFDTLAAPAKPAPSRVVRHAARLLRTRTSVPPDPERSAA